MNYSNHNLRTDLQEWKNRLYRAPYNQFGHQLKYFFNNLSTNKQIFGILNEAINQYPFEAGDFDEISTQMMRGSNISFENEIHHSAFCYQFITHFVMKFNTYELHDYSLFIRSDSQETRNGIIEDFISPIIYFLHDKLNESNSTIYLLEKYKRRTEWFTKKDLFQQYFSAEKNYEQLLEDDLRLFLFDQGIDYPFSTPKSASGRADIIGEIETDNPLVVEIKIFDREKGYGKDRIKDGFSQIVKYTNDYHKDVGYLVIYNMDKAELNLNFSAGNKIFPPSIAFNNKKFYFVVINSSMQSSASKSGIIQEVEITETELINK